MNVLIIDDSKEDCFLIKKILEKSFSTLSVEFAYTLEEAVPFVTNPTFDFILLDYYLPDGDGLDFLKKMSDLPFKVPVIMLTGCKDEKLEKQVIEAGAQDYLIKGKIDDAILVKSIEHSLERVFNIKELEAARKKTIEALKVKEDFMSIMTHELLTPLTGIINGVQLLRGDIDDNNKVRAKELCSIIEESGNSLHMTINNILEYTALDGSEISLYKDKIEVKSLVTFFKHRFEEAISEKGLNFTIKVSKSVPDIFVSDLKRVKQIIYNLISNAIKFTDRGEIIVVFSVKNQKLIITISDTGKGIKEEYIGQIFSEFTQEDSSYSRSCDGTGLGLSIVKKITRLLGGNIKVLSKEGLGSTFTVALPLVEIAF